jgi:hypothetical protein
MQKLAVILVLFALFLGCEKNQMERQIKDDEYIARIVGFDLNCSTCILEFPNDSLQIKNEIGKSPNNFYEAINLNRENYEIGQIIKVKLRKPKENELIACITLYPSYNYKSIFISESRNPDELVLNDTTIIFNKTCKFNSENKIYLCLDSILEDSRCPIGALCIWEGNARIKFHFEKFNETPVYFILNTHPNSTNEIIIDRFKISLLNLLPYPSIKNIDSLNRRAEILVKEI